MSIEHATQWISPECAATCPFFMECDEIEKELLHPTEGKVIPGPNTVNEDGEPWGDMDILLAVYRAKVSDEVIESRLAWERHQAGATCSKKEPKLQRRTGQLACTSFSGRLRIAMGLNETILIPRPKRDKYTG